MNEAVEKARKAWESAPMHVRMMAGAYVDPMVVGLLEIAARLEKHEKWIEELSLRLSYQGAKNG